MSAILAVTILAGCGTTQKEESKKDGKLKVAVTFDAMAEFVKAVGKDKVDIITIIPAGTEPHEFEPSTDSMKALATADMLVYNGMGMEPWIEKAVEAAHNDKLVKVEASKGVDAIKIRILKKWRNTVNTIPIHGSACAMRRRKLQTLRRLWVRRIRTIKSFTNRIHVNTLLS